MKVLFIFKLFIICSSAFMINSHFPSNKFSLKPSYNNIQLRNYIKNNNENYDYLKNESYDENINKDNLKIDKNNDDDTDYSYLIIANFISNDELFNINYCDDISHY